MRSHFLPLVEYFNLGRGTSAFLGMSHRCLLLFRMTSVLPFVDLEIGHTAERDGVRDNFVRDKNCDQTRRTASTSTR